MRNIIRPIVVSTVGLLVLAGCGSINQGGVTCTYLDDRFHCGIDLYMAQDPLASSEVEDEKPVESLTRPLRRSEEVAP